MKKWILAAAGAVLLAGVGAGLWLVREDPTGMALGDGGAQKALWNALAPSARFLKAYNDQLSQPPDDPMLALTAFNELAYAMTGPSGLWRKTVPKRYFGCDVDDTPPLCQEFKRLDALLAPWDQLQQRIASVPDERAARTLLRENARRFQEYVRTFVPADASLDQVQQTPFFRDHFARYLPP